MGASACSYPGCGRDAWRTGLCPAHYQQKRRTGEMKPIREPLPEDERTQVNVRCPLELKDQAGAAAEAAGMTESDWWRLAAQEKLERDASPKGKKKRA